MTHIPKHIQGGEGRGGGRGRGKGGDSPLLLQWIEP